MFTSFDSMVPFLGIYPKVIIKDAYEFIHKAVFHAGFWNSKRLEIIYIFKNGEWLN